MIKGVITAAYDTDSNTVDIKTEGVSGKFQVLLNYDMVDFAKPVNIVVNGTAKQETLTPSREIMDETMKERGDKNFIFSAKVDVTV